MKTIDIFIIFIFTTLFDNNISVQMRNKSESKIVVFFLQFLHFLFDRTHFLGLEGFLCLFHLVFIVIGASNTKPERNSIHSELFSHILSQKTEVVIFENIFAVHKENEMRRPHSCLNKIIYLQSHFFIFG